MGIADGLLLSITQPGPQLDPYDQIRQLVIEVNILIQALRNSLLRYEGDNTAVIATTLAAAKQYADAQINTLSTTVDTVQQQVSSVQGVDTFTLGSVLFAGVGGVVTENNANFFWDNTGLNHGIGTTSFGASAAKTLAIANGTAPTGSVANQFHLYGKAAAVGKSWGVFREEGNTTIDRFVMGVSATSTAGASVRGVNGSTTAGNTGWLTVHDHTGATVYIPYWTAT